MTSNFELVSIRKADILLAKEKLGYISKIILILKKSFS